MSNNLFDYKQQVQRQRVPWRPLGALSTFVVEEMPTLLTQIRTGAISVSTFENRIAELLASTPNSVLENARGNASSRDVATLDLKMLENSLVFSSGTVPQVLAQHVDAFSLAASLVPGMTYEELILVNPVNDRRTFTDGQIGQSEYDFYEVHRLIEEHMDIVVAQMWAAITVLTNNSGVNIDQVVDILTIVASELKKIIALMRAVGRQMKPEHFKTFRLYLDSHPYRQYNGEQLKGGSGAFSATIPLVDLLLSGEILQGDHMAYLHVNMPYFPRSGQQQLEQAFRIIQEERTLNAFYHRLGEPLELKGVLVEISNILHQFRGAHYQGVSHQLPEAIKGQVAGTGGESDVSGFLLRRVRTKHIEQ